MDISIGALGSDYSVKPLNYSIQNKAKFSSAYTESIAAGSASGVRAASPVKYPDAQLIESPQALQARAAEDSIAANKAYNRIADSFNGAITGYGNSGMGSAYQTAGTYFDAYA